MKDGLQNLDLTSCGLALRCSSAVSQRHVPRYCGFLLSCLPLPLCLPPLCVKHRLRCASDAVRRPVSLLDPPCTPICDSKRLLIVCFTWCGSQSLLDLNMCPPPRSKGQHSKQAAVSSGGHHNGLAAQAGQSRPPINDQDRNEVG